MPSDALALNLGKLNNSIEKLFPLLNAVVVNSKESSQKGSKKEGVQKLDNAVKAMSSGMFMSIIIDNASSKELVKANDSMKNLVSTAGGMDKAAIESFKNNIASLTATINSINIGNAKAIKNLNNYILVLTVFVNQVNSLNNSKFKKASTDLEVFGKSLNKFIQIINKFNKIDKLNNKNLIKDFILLSSIDFNKITKNLNNLNKLDEKLSNKIKLFNTIITALSKGNNINVKNINKLSEIRFNFKELNKISKLNISDEDVKSFSKIISELSKIKKLNIKSINKLADLEFKDLIKQFNSLSKIKPEAKAGVLILNSIINSLAQVNKIDVKKIHKVFKELSDLDFKSIIKGFAELNKINPNTKKGLDEFIKIISSLEDLESINVRKTLRKLKRLFKGLDNITLSLTTGKKKLDIVQISGLADFINAAKTAEKINVSKATRKINRLDEFFKKLNDIVNETILGKDSPFADKSKRKELDDTIKLINKFMDSNKVMMKAMAINALLGIPALLGFGFSWLIYHGLIGLLKKLSGVKIDKNTSDAIRNLSLFALSIAGVLGIMVIAAKIYESTDPEAVWATFGLLAATTVLFSAIAIIAKRFGTAEINGAKTLGVFALIMVGVTGTIMLLSKFLETTNPIAVIGTIGIMAIVALGLWGISNIASSIDVKDLKGMAALGIMAFIMISVTGSIVLIAKEYAEIGPGPVWATLGLMTVTTLVLVGIGKLASLVKVNSLLGVAVIGIMAVIMIGTTIAVVKIAEEVDRVGFGTIMAGLGTMALIAVSLVALGALLGYGMVVTGPAIAGALALAAITTSMAFAMSKVVELHNIIKNNKEVFELKTIDGKQQIQVIATISPIIKSILELGSSLGETSLSSYIKTTRTLRLVNRLLNTINKMTDTLIKFDKSGISTEQISKIASNIGLGIQTFLTMTFETMSKVENTTFRTITKAKRTFRLLNRLLTISDKFLDIITRYSPNSKNGNKDIIGLSKISATNIGEGLSVFLTMTFETMSKVEGVTNKTIVKARRTFRLVNRLLNLSDKFLDIITRYSPNKGNGNKDIIGMSVSSGQTISKALLGFIDTFFNGFDGDDEQHKEGLEVRTNRENNRIRKTLKNIQRLVDITSSFIDSMGKAEQLKDVHQVTENAEIIANAISSFTKITFSVFDTAGDPKEIRKQIKNFKRVIEPVTGFVDMITSVASENGNLGKIRFDENGKILEIKYVDVKNIATIIATSVSNFLGELYKPDNIEKWKNVSGSTSKKLGKLLNVIDPINSFIDLLSKYNVNGDVLEVLNFDKVDKDGNPTISKKVDVKRVSASLSRVITNFMNEFYKKENIDKWNEISGKNIKQANKKIGKLTEVIEPISSFTEMLSQFSSNDKLVKIDTATGNITATVSVNTIANNIAGCVSTFLRTLYSHETEWSNLSAWGVAKEAVGAVVDAGKDLVQGYKLGKFAEIISPIASFMTLITSYKWNGTSLMAPNGDGTDREINIAEAGNNIAAAIKTFTDSVYNTETDIKDGTNNILIVGESFETAFKKIDDTIEKTKNDKRIKELQRLSNEFKKLSENIDKMVKSSEKVTDAINTVNSASGSINSNSSSSSGSNTTSSDSSSNTSNNKANQANQIDYNKLQSSVTTGIQNAFNTQYKFKANCTYDKSLQEIIITRQ